LPKFAEDKEVLKRARERECKYAQDFDYRLEVFLLSLSENLARWMELNGITKAELAAKLAVSRSSITQLLRGDTNFRIATLLRISEALNLKLQVDFRPAYQVLHRKTVKLDFSKQTHLISMLGQEMRWDFDETKIDSSSLPVTFVADHSCAQHEETWH
jgi:transcriptional regulator with XRE-family HTH domain